MHVGAGKQCELFTSRPAFFVRKCKSRLAVIHCVLMTRKQQFLLVLEELVERRFACLQSRRDFVHRCIVKATSIESRRSSKGDCFPAFFPQCRSAEQRDAGLLGGSGLRCLMASHFLFPT